jgi:hypothetical protein
MTRAIPREVSNLVLHDAGEAYALGLWCADSYWWSSSIGISNVQPELVIRFARFLCTVLPPERLRLRVYEVPGDSPDARVLELTSSVSIRPPVKMKRTAYHLYVNSRPLVRSFFVARERVGEIPVDLIAPYLAGRFDGDGSIGDTPRIAYTTQAEAETDCRLLEALDVRRTSVLYYVKANEYCVYIHKADYARFERLIAPWSWKVAHPVETAMASLGGRENPNL